MLGFPPSCRRNGRKSSAKPGRSICRPALHTASSPTAAARRRVSRTEGDQDMKKLIAAALFAAFGVWTSVALASTSTSDITDMWYNPNESGWGVNVIEQNDVAFITFFVYDAQKIPMWYTSALFYQG